jgi:hemerythrin
MSFVEWKPELSVGVLRFDDEHRHLISLLNQLRTALAKGREKLVLGAILKELVWYTRIHFRAEEQHMKDYGYPDLATHTAEHERFTTQVAQYAEQFHGGQVEFASEVVGALEYWLLRHIQQSDGAYGKYLESLRGLEAERSQPFL